MQPVLDTPVIAQRLAIVAGTGPLAADEVAGLRSGLAVDLPLAATHADHFQFGRGIRAADAGTIMPNRVVALLGPAVAFSSVPYSSNSRPVKSGSNACVKQARRSSARLS